MYYKHVYVHVRYRVCTRLHISCSPLTKEVNGLTYLIKVGEMTPLTVLIAAFTGYWSGKRKTAGLGLSIVNYLASLAQRLGYSRSKQSLSFVNLEHLPIR